MSPPDQPLPPSPAESRPDPVGVPDELWLADLTRRHFIEQGLDLGAYVFDRLYRDLHRIAVTG